MRSNVAKFIKIENIFVVVRIQREGGRDGKWWRTVNVFDLSSGGDKYILELDSMNVGSNCGYIKNYWIVYFKREVYGMWSILNLKTL